MSSSLKALQSVGATRFGAHDTPNRRRIIEAGAIGALVGGVCIWIYEAIVWVWAQHQMPLIGIPGNATGLVFGKEVQQALGSCTIAGRSADDRGDCPLRVYLTHAPRPQ